MKRVSKHRSAAPRGRSRYDPADSAVEILLIEDTEEDAERTIRALKKGRVHCRVTVVDNGDDALTYLAGSGTKSAPSPDLILLDWYLPKKDGHEVLEDIKRHPDWRRIPIVILSMSDRENDVRAAYDGHANSFVTKPADQEQLVKAMKSIEIFWKGRSSRPRNTVSAVTEGQKGQRS